MKNKKLLWQLYPSYLAIIVIILVSISLLVSIELKSFLSKKIQSDIEIRAKLVRELSADLISERKNAEIDNLCKKLGSQINARVTIISPSGEVLGDSAQEPLLEDNHANRPEVIQALNSNEGNSVRYSHTLKTDMLYVALPVAKNGKLSGVIRLSIPLSFIDKTLNSLYWKIVISGIIIAIIAAFFSWYISRRIKKPLEDIEEGARNFAQGNLNYSISVPAQREMNNLANALNNMAGQLNQRITTIMQQKMQQDAVFSSMEEGVIAVDIHKRIIKMNDAAANLLGVNKDEVKGLKIKDITGKTALHQFIKKTFAGSEQFEEYITLNHKEDLFLQARSRVLRDHNNENIGAVVVLNNLTHLRKLENIRKDFVANVSHELRTPITSIKGFVETLLESDLKDNGETVHFLEIIRKHADRLNLIIDDLLSLSKIEQGNENSEIKREECFLKDVLESAIEVCQLKANDKNINIELSVDEAMKLKINSSLIEQSIVNLVDNAIKYSNYDEKLIVDAYEKSNEIIINVRDFGCGIPQDHIPRLFERFYRVDKARSRSAGGTGLGLAIVKHIAQAHKGFVTVESIVNKGSVFSLHLPK